MNYKFGKKVTFDERVTIYCQMVSQYETVFEITEQYSEKEEIEFAMIYPK